MIDKSLETFLIVKNMNESLSKLSVNQDVDIDFLREIGERNIDDKDVDHLCTNIIIPNLLPVLRDS